MIVQIGTKSDIGGWWMHVDGRMTNLGFFGRASLFPKAWRIARLHNLKRVPPDGSRSHGFGLFIPHYQWGPK